MINLVTSDQISENEATEKILNAARANPDRISKGGVLFKNVGGTHFRAVINNEAGEPIAQAMIDESDI